MDRRLYPHAMKTAAVSITIENELSLPSLFGEMDKNLRLIENTYGVMLHARGNKIQIEGEEKSVAKVEHLIKQLAAMLERGIISHMDDVSSAIHAYASDPSAALKDIFQKAIPVSSRKRPVAPKNEAQRRYIEAIRQFDIVFGIGPAGTGKTYLAMATAVSALLRREVSRIILVRPAVEAGEKLGFLPGDLYEKVNPYLRPLYDALYDMIETEKANKLVERGDIEIAPLAFMRGRTLNDSFIILDEAQNTTSEQMKMFLTRLGFNSKTVVTGDITQIDLPSDRNSGLIEVQKILEGIEGIHFMYFTNRDVVRHKLVQQIIKAYEKYETSDEEQT
ncbi:MAG TPA: PhoH family protein [Nitrospirota bacterium]|nr:PhoH family protein [Nitrospirota bacterium]